MGMSGWMVRRTGGSDETSNPIHPMKYTLQYREPGKRPGTKRWATRPVDSVAEADAFLKADPTRFPGVVKTRNWKKETVAFIA